MIECGLHTRRSSDGEWRVLTGSADVTSVSVSEAPAHGGQTPEAPLATSELSHGTLQFFLAEVGPVQRCRPVFGIGSLPDQEVAEPHLPGRPDDEIRIAHTLGVQVRAERLLIQLVRVQAIAQHSAGGL